MARWACAFPAASGASSIAFWNSTLASRVLPSLSSWLASRSSPPAPCARSVPGISNKAMLRILRCPEPLHPLGLFLPLRPSVPPPLFLQLSHHLGHQRLRLLRVHDPELDRHDHVVLHHDQRAPRLDHP